MLPDESLGKKSHQSVIQCLVSNVRFELDENLIKKRTPNSLLACEDRRSYFYDHERNLYVFDQPADVFEVLVYFISTGLLSRPINIDEKKLRVSSKVFFLLSRRKKNSFIF